MGTVPPVVLDPFNVCQSMPDSPDQEIQRDNVLDSLDRQLGGDHSVVVVEGLSGAGKTVLLSQFARRHAARSFSLFVTAANRFASLPDTLRFDLCNQLSVSLDHREFKEPEQATDVSLNHLLMRLQRAARREQAVYYFVIDGLDEFASDDNLVVSNVLDLLPLGSPGFRFVVAGTLEELNFRPKLRPSCRSQDLPFFTQAESINYLSDLHLDIEQIRAFHAMCGGMPEYLASVRRIAAIGESASVVFQMGPPAVDDIFDVEWERSKPRAEPDLLILAIIAFAQANISLHDLVNMTDRGSATILQFLTPLSFISTPSAADTPISYVSDAFRMFVATKVASFKDAAFDMILRHLANSDRPDALVTRARYLAEAERFDKLVALVTDDGILDAALQPRSLEELLGLATDAAILLKDVDHAVRFALHGTTLSHLTDGSIRRSEILAFCALGLHDEALALAQAAAGPIGRLRLLAALARGRREAQLPADPELSGQIQQLFAELRDGLELPNAEALAEDLLYIDPALALEAINAAGNAESSVEENALDFALTKLNIQALVADSRGQDVSRALGLTAKIRDPSLRQLSQKAALILGHSSADEIVAQSQGLTSGADQMYVMRKWMTVNRQREDAHKVLEHGLDVAVKTTGYVPNAAAIRDLALCLPHLSTQHMRRYFIDLVQAQLPSIQKQGPTEAVVQLELLMARSELRDDTGAAGDRLLQIYCDIADVEDLEVRASCFARLLNAIAEVQGVDNVRDLPVSDTAVERQFTEEIDTLRSASASHAEIFRPIIQALAPRRPDLVTSVIKGLNTVRRRDESYETALDAALATMDEPAEWSAIREWIEALADGKQRDTAVAGVLEAILRRKHWKLSRAVSEMLATHALRIGDAPARMAACSMLLIHSKREQLELAQSRLEMLKREVLQAWRTLDDPREQSMTACEAIKRLADDANDEALEIAEALRGVTTPWVDEDLLLNRVRLSTRVAIRGHTALVKMAESEARDLDRIGRVIGSIPSTAMRAALWAEFSLCLRHAGAHDAAQMVAREKVRPQLGMLPDGDKTMRSWAVTRCFPALHLDHPNTAIELLAEVELSEQDAAWSGLFEASLWSCVPGEVELDADVSVSVGYELAIDLVDVVRHVHEDMTVCVLLESLVEAVVNGRKDARLTGQQIDNIVRRCEEVIDQKLPASGFITHEGYVIVALATLNQLRRKPAPTWEELESRATMIENVADQAFVLSHLAKLVDGALEQERLIAKAGATVERVVPRLDRIDRHVFLAGTIKTTNSRAAKKHLGAAVDVAQGGDGESTETRQRRIVDVAQQIDEKFAEALVTRMDRDPARERLRAQQAVTDILRRLDTGKRDTGRANAHPDDVARAAWRRLREMNARRVGPFNMNATQELLLWVQKHPLESSFPILLLVIENMRQSSGGKKKRVKLLKALREGALTSAEIGVRLAGARTGGGMRHFGGIGKDKVKVWDIGDGERDRALQLIKEWLVSNVTSYLKIADPYITPQEIELLRVIKDVVPFAKIEILTSLKAQQQRQTERSVDEEFESAWRSRWSDSPNLTQFTVAGLKGDLGSPIHDRWWITRGGGLETGTSWGSIGRKKMMSIRVMDSVEAAVKEDEVDRYLSMTAKDVNGVRINYQSFVLGEERE